MGTEAAEMFFDPNQGKGQGVSVGNTEVDVHSVAK